ncbi:MAG: M15 family metallopeptidase [Alphaproteobacteria bacterium]
MTSIKAKKNFSSQIIPNDIAQDMIEKNIWNEKCPVSIDRLRLLSLSYYGFDNNVHDDGQMIVLDIVSDRVLIIFKELYNKKFPIKKIKLMNDYNGDDDLSMKDNNSSAFMCREITGGGKASLHSYGVAIDINPIQNPYFKPSDQNIILSPIKSSYFVNRTNIRPGMVETVKDIFINNGFKIWGGNWNDPIDWMHFQLDRELTEKLIKMDKDLAIKYFNSI